MNGDAFCSTQPGRTHYPSDSSRDESYWENGTLFTRDQMRDSGLHRRRYIAVRICKYCGREIYTRNLGHPKSLNWESWSDREGTWHAFDAWEVFRYIIKEEEELSWL